MVSGLSPNLNISFALVHTCVSVSSPDGNAVPPTSPRPSDVVQAPSGDSLASVSSSPRSETPPFLAEVCQWMHRLYLDGSNQDQNPPGVPPGIKKNTMDLSHKLGGAMERHFDDKRGRV